MDYSELVEALNRGDKKKADKILKHMLPRLVKYLQIRMGASKSDAEDCVQYSMERALEVLQNDKLKNADHVFSYLISTCRNNYLKSLEKRREVNYDEIPETEFNNPNQIRSLLDKERTRILEECLDELKKMYRDFIEYWFKYPDSDADVVADHFDISVNNVWTRKHRVLKKLNKCYEEKSSK